MQAKKKIYAEKLIKEGIIDDAYLKQLEGNYRDWLEEQLQDSKKVKKTKVSTTTVISLRLENETVETVDAIRKWLCLQDDETELTRAGAIKDAINDWIEKYNPDRIYDEMNNGQGYEEKN